MQIKLTLNADYKETPPRCRIYSKHSDNQVELNNNGSNLVECDFHLDIEDFIKIEFHNKDDQDDNTIMIQKIVVDGIDLQHFIYGGSFSPIYNKEWFDKQDPKPPLSYCPCTELRHNGTWVMEIKLPIWKMIMNRWVDDER